MAIIGPFILMFTTRSTSCLYCRHFLFSDKFDNSEEEKLSLASDLESVITFYCKSKNVRYESHNGWLDILGPLVALRMEKSDLYNCFYALITKYIPRYVDQQKYFHIIPKTGNVRNALCFLPYLPLV